MHPRRKGLDLCATDSPSEAIQPTTWRRVRRVHHDLPVRPIDPMAEPFKVGVDRKLSGS